METEKHYFRVGIFAVLVVIGFVFYVMAFSGRDKTEEYKRYAIYFDNSVAGLTRGAPVKLKGIVVGTVDDIHFIARDNDRIAVIADIADTAPVRVDTVATVAFQGITGTAYVALENTKPFDPPVFLKKEKGEKYPVIISRKSDLQEVLSNAPTAMDGVAKAAAQVQKLISDQNVEATHVLLAEAAGALREFRMLARMLRDDPSVILRGSSYEGYKTKQ